MVPPVEDKPALCPFSLINSTQRIVAKPTLRHIVGIDYGFKSCISGPFGPRWTLMLFRLASQLLEVTGTNTTVVILLMRDITSKLLSTNLSVTVILLLPSTNRHFTALRWQLAHGSLPEHLILL